MLIVHALAEPPATGDGHAPVGYTVATCGITRTMKSPAELLDARRGELMERWKRRVRSELDPSGLTDGELVDHLPLVLEELSRTLRAQQGHREPPSPSRAKQLAQLHGEQRFRKGFDLRRLVQEFGLLRDCVIDLFQEEGLANVLEPILLTNRFITDAVTESVAQFVAERDGDLLERVQFEQQLIGIVSHDLRDPLASIQLAAGTLLQPGSLDAQQASIVSRIFSASDRAIRLIADLLDFTATRFGPTLTIRRSPCDIHQLVRQVVDEIALGASKRQLTLKAEGDGQGEWDDDRIAQIVTNLVNNALVYSPDSSTIVIQSRGEPTEIRLSVHNEGAPIPTEAMASLFKPMVRASRVSSKSGRSIGLGLYIVDQIVRAHGGRVDVRSAAAEGTTFTVTLPRHAPRAMP